MKTMKTKSALLMSVLSLVLCLAMLTGTTFAWFTDTVTSANNKIVAGTLKIDLSILEEDNTTWTSIKNSKDPIFDYDKWEPGYVNVKVLKIDNKGTLALKWYAKFISENEVGVLADVIDVYVCPSETVALTYPDNRNLDGYTKVGTLRQFINTIETTTKGTLEAGKSAYLGIALKMREEAGNEYQGKKIEAFDIQILATQLTSEKDSFDSNYDMTADFDGEVSTLTALGAAAEKGGNYKFVANIATDEPVAVPAGETVLFDLNGKTLEGSLVAETGATLTIGNGTISNEDKANSGIQSNGATLTINNADITSARHAVRIEGGTATINGGTYKTAVSPDRTTAMTQHALNVSDGAKVVINGGTFIGPKGTGADSGSAVNVQAGSTVIINGGDFSGGLNKTLSSNGTLTIYGGTFDQDPSAYVAKGYSATYENGKWTVAEATADIWDGTADTTWYNDADTTFIITTAEQFAGFGKLVDDGNTFEGKTVALGADLDLYVLGGDNEPVSFDPIGYGYNVVFKGTFDGQNHTIKNLYQDGWALGLQRSTEGGGLFASVVDATIKNVTLENAEVVMYCIDMGILVGYSYGNCTYENITITDSVIGNYQRYTGGLVGEVNGTQTFTDINIVDTVVAALWGDFDTSVGGIIGGKWGDADITFTRCNVDCVIDAYNDCTSAAEWFLYRRAGMLIGNSEETANIDGRTVATATYLTCVDCTVTYRDWANYTYCKFSSMQYPWVRVQAGLQHGAYSNPRTGNPTDANGNTVTDDNHVHAAGDECQNLLAFNQLYGGGTGCKGAAEHTGVTIIYK